MLSVWVYPLVIWCGKKWSCRVREEDPGWRTGVWHVWKRFGEGNILSKWTEGFLRISKLVVMSKKTTQTFLYVLLSCVLMLRFMPRVHIFSIIPNEIRASRAAYRRVAAPSVSFWCGCSERFEMKIFQLFRQSPGLSAPLFLRQPVI